MNLGEQMGNSAESEEEKENIDLTKLSFEQLQKARELGEKSLKRTDRGFMMIDGKELFFAITPTPSIS